MTGLFPTITGGMWGGAIAKARAEGNAALVQIRAATVATFIAAGKPVASVALAGGESIALGELLRITGLTSPHAIAAMESLRWKPRGVLRWAGNICVVPLAALPELSAELSVTGRLSEAAALMTWITRQNDSPVGCGGSAKPDRVTTGGRMPAAPAQQKSRLLQWEDKHQ